MTQQNTKIQNIFLEVENFRKKLLIKFFAFLTTVIVGSYLMIKYLNANASDDHIALFAIVYPFVFYFLIKYPFKYLKDYKIFYKEKIIPLVLADEKNFHFSNTSYINLPIYSDVVPNYHEIESEDHILGNVEDIAFQFCEIDLKRISLANAMMTYQHTEPKKTSFFKGCTIIIDLPFSFKENIALHKNSDVIDEKIKSLTLKKKKINLENPDFEKIFDVFSNDDHTARYILSPGLMKNIIELHKSLSKHVKIKSMKAEFRDNQAIFICEYKGNLIEPASLFKPAFNVEKLKESKEEINFIINITKQLKLDYLKDRKLAYKNFNQQLNNIK